MCNLSCFFQIFISTTIDNNSLPDKIEELLTMIIECEKEKLFCGEPKDEMTSLKVHYKNNLFQRGELKAIFDIRELFHEKVRYEEKTGQRLFEQESSVFSAVPGALVVDNFDDACFNSDAVVQP
ncbi:unnamed protein product, partial [Didymodactylos carnosus]